tara:strand:+ start:216 stop:1094 length:879 start_codon:yes stop_codon:yes gene_type:complete
MMKVCKKCGVKKPLGDFGKGGKQLRADGTLKQYYRTTCKQCINTGPMKRKDNIDPKQCIKCGIIKPLSDYPLEKNSHGNMRYKSECIECKRIRHKRWLEKNPDKMRVYYDTRNEKARTNPEIRKKLTEGNRRWRETGDNRDRLNATARKRYWNNPDETGMVYQGQKDTVLARTKNYRENWTDEQKQLEKARRKRCWDNNREELNEYNKEWTRNRKNLIKEKMGGKCVICGATENLQFDHINPLEKSYNISTNFFRQDVDEELAKCQLLCSRCHLEKTKNDWSSGVLTEKRGY